MNEQKSSLWDVLKFFENRYTYFLATILILFFVHPLLSVEAHAGFPFANLTFLAVIIAIFWSLQLKPRLFKSCVIFACLTFTADMIHYVRVNILGYPQVTYFDASIVAVYAAFIFVAILILMGNLFRNSKVTSDTIRGGISVYFLIGIFWALLYHVFLLIDSDALIIPYADHTFSDLLYYSFTTLTTLGYGDITPLAPFVQNLAALEAVVGQLFLTIYVARLIGLHLANHR